MLDAHAEEFTEEMALAAARAIADVVGEDKLNPTVIVPSVFDPRVAPAVAAAIRAVVQGAALPATRRAADIAGPARLASRHPFGDDEPVELRTAARSRRADAALRRQPVAGRPDRRRAASAGVS